MSNYNPEPLMGKRGDDSVFYRVAVGNDARHAKVCDTPRTLIMIMRWNLARLTSLLFCPADQ
jgi:hypothetical protein